MAEFVVSARKYRPVRFDEVVGQQHVSETLKNALRQNRLAHAFLFCGPRGVGKTTNARILAKVLNCLNVTSDFEPCNTCSNCQAFAKNASFNIFELDGASNNKVEHMHQLMEQVRIPPQSGRKKVYIIDEVHMLSQAAFNAFLKTLEEPPEYAIFILATTEKHKILPTILSRCQVYDFHRIRQHDMVAHLQSICDQEGIQAEPEALHLIAEKADGALRDALSIFDRVLSASVQTEGSAGKTLSYVHTAGQLNVLDHQTFFEVVDAMLAEDVASLYLIFDKVLSNGFEPEPFLGGLARHLRQLFVSKNPNTLSLVELSDSLRQQYQVQAAKASPNFLVNALNLAAECDYRMRLAAQPRLLVEIYLVKMAYATRTVQVEGIGLGKSSGIEEFEAKTSGPLETSIPAPKANEGLKAQPTYQENLEPTKPAIASAESVEIEMPEPEVVLESSALVHEPEPIRSTAAPAKPSTAAQLLKSKGLSLQLPSLDFDEEDEDDGSEQRKPEDLTIEMIQAAWDQLAEQQPQRLKAVMKAAQLNYQNPRLLVEVGGRVAQNSFRSSEVDLRMLKDLLGCQDIEIAVELNESLAPKVPEKPKAMGPQEQYQMLLDLNPMVEGLRQALELDPD